MTIATLAEIRSENDLQDAFRQDVLKGLSLDQKVVPARWFYDRRGSELFEQITELPEYYPTRSELSILAKCCPKVAKTSGKGRTVVEFGAGSATKTPILIEAIDPSSYVPIDISGDFLADSCKDLARSYPGMPIFPIEADFTEPVAFPPEVKGHDLLGFFPGSTIGNMEPAAAVDLLRVMRDTLGNGAHLLIGMDRIKDIDVLTSAYDDAAGVTAEFNLNLLTRINRELDGDIPVEAFSHKAVWNDPRARIEMHLKTRRSIEFTVRGQSFLMRKGETIHTENSHKYGKRSASLMLLAGGWEPIRTFTDPDKAFMAILAQATPRDITA